MRIKPLLIAAALALFAIPAFAQTVKLIGPTGQIVNLDAKALAAQPHVHVTLSVHGETHVYEGPLLIDLLGQAGAPTGAALHGAALADVVVVTGADGYRVAFGLGELDPGVRSEKIILADRVDGGPIPAKDGPLRLVAEGDLRPVRSVRMVTSVSVSTAGAWGVTPAAAR